MTATATLDPALPEGLEEALARATPEGVLDALRALPVKDPSRVADRILDEAVVRLRRDGRLSFWIARHAIGVASRGGAAAAAARGLKVAGQALFSLGRLRPGLRLLDRALESYRVLGLEGEAATVQLRRTYPLVQLGRHAEAADAARQALEIHRRRDDAEGIAQAETALGDLAYRQDRFRDALGNYARAAALLPASGHPRTRAILDCNSANCLEALHRYRAAERRFARARAVLEAEGLRHAVAQVDYNRAYFALVRGRYAESLDLYRTAEHTFQELGDERQIGQIRLELAELHLQLGMTAEARELARDAERVLSRAGVGKECAQAVLHAGVAELTEGRPVEADRAFVAARARFVEERAAAGPAECDLLRATAAAVRGDRDMARELASAARASFIAAGRVERAASAELVLARLELDEGKVWDAHERLEALGQGTRRLDSPWLHLELRRLRARAFLALHEERRGLAMLEAAVSLLEARRGTVPGDEFMVSFLAARADLYGEAVEAFAQAGRGREAFEYCERARSRALVDMLAARRGPRPVASEGRGEFRDARLGRLREELDALYARLYAADEHSPDGEARRAPLRERMAKLESVLAARMREAWARDPEFASLGAVGAFPLHEVQAVLDEETALLEYFFANGRLHAFVVRARSFEHRVLEVSPALLEMRLRRFRFHLAGFELGAARVERAAAPHLNATVANLRGIAAALVAPLEDLLVPGGRLVVVPHGILHGLPFHALPCGDGWLGDAFRVAYAPSAAVYVFCSRKRPSGEGPPCVLAVPDAAAPLVAVEADAVRRAMGPGACSLVGEAATSAALREAAATSRLLHIATHGTHRPDHPTLSSLRLADTWLNVYDVYGLTIGAEQVVLSACESGVARVGAGDELMGLARAFLFAGAPRVLCSQWRVSDEATASLMESYHAALGRGVPCEIALQDAMRRVRELHPHPYHWAAFFMVGYPGGGRPDRPKATWRTQRQNGRGER